MNVELPSVQRGFSLVELMVAMVVSLLLLSGVIQVFVSSKQSYRVVDSYSRLQENGRFAVDVLSRNIRMAGYRSNIWEIPAVAFPPNVPYASTGQAVFGSDGASDSITFRYQGSGDGFIEDCLGGNVGAGTTASVTFRIDATDNELECSVNAAGIPQPLIDGVENMQIVYGVDTNGDFSANQFRTATNVTASGQWNNIIAVRIGLLLNTVGNVSYVNDSQNYDLVGTNVTAGADLLRRHRFVTTINLRNRTP